MIDIISLHMKEEKLCDELLPHVTKGPLGQMIHHPLVIEMFYDPKHCALVNARYRHKVEETAMAKSKGSWLKYVFLHERPYRIEALRRVTLTTTDVASLVAAVWVDSENIWENFDNWISIWDSLPNPRMTMLDSERAVYDDMPDTVEVFRGIRHRSHAPDGMSWTRSRERARWFARRYPQKGLRPCVLTGIVKKENVLAFFNGRNEEEVVVFPRNVVVRRRA